MRKNACAIIEILLSLVLALGTTSFACSTEPAAVLPPSQQSMASDPEIPANYITYTDDLKLFSISYPSDWEPALSNIEDMEKEAKEAINDMQSGLPLESASVIFYAGQLVEAGYYDPNVTIVVEPIPEGFRTIDQVAESGIASVKMIAQDYREFSRVKTVINGREATIVDYEGTFSGGPKRHSLAMITLAGKAIWWVSCQTIEDDFTSLEKDFQAIVRSLRISY